MNWIMLRLRSLFRVYYWQRRIKKMGRKVKIYHGVVAHSPKKVEIGNNSAIGDYVVIWGGGGVMIGNDVLIAAHSVISSESHDPNADIFRLSHLNKPIVIEDNVWIGASVMVMPGVTIGSNSVVGAGSVVTKDIPPDSVAVGVPAKVIRKRK